MSSTKKSAKANAKANESPSDMNDSGTDLLQVAASVRRQAVMLKKDDQNSLLGLFWKNKETYLTAEDAGKQLAEQKTLYEAAKKKKEGLDTKITKTNTLKSTAQLLLPRLETNLKTAQETLKKAEAKYQAEENKKGYNATKLSVEQLEKERLAHNARLVPYKETYDQAKLDAETAAKALDDKKTEIQSSEKEIKNLVLLVKETKGEMEIYATQIKEKGRVEAIAKLSDSAKAWMDARDQEQKQKRKFYTQAMEVGAEYDLAQLLAEATEHSDSKKLKR